jgi:hypothetical protein
MMNNRIRSNDTRKALNPSMGLRRRILQVLDKRGGKFTSVDIAQEIGYPLDYSAFYPSCKNVRVILTDLCKRGLLYQWIIGEGMSVSTISNTPKYAVYYLRRDSSLAEILTNHPNRRVNGYRIS